MERVISPEEFSDLISRRASELMGLAVYVAANPEGRRCFTRPLVGRLHLEATRAEELLDAYGAKQNQRWYALRRLVAPLKLFSRVAYLLQHLLQFLPTYQLLPVGEDFQAATEKALAYTCAVLRQTVSSLVDRARALGVRVPEEVPEAAQFSEELPHGHLPFDRPVVKVASPEETVVYLATAFLNLAEDSKFLHLIQETPEADYADWIPEPVSEERLRDLEEKFHSLQSLYDTHISDSNVESLDDSLPVLRGHISVIFHLLETATQFTHYCERHVPSFSGASAQGDAIEPRIDPARLLDVLMNYSLAFASRYISRTRNLCHEMLRRYAIQGHISLPVPRYRGFHVRPSTLIARIVNHYGSPVQMTLDGETYNAGVTLDLFRANEKLNARKRRRLAEEVYRLALAGEIGRKGEDPEALACDVRRVVRSLFEQNKLVLYERTLQLDGLKRLNAETPVEFVLRALNQLLAMGKIDVEMETMVTFAGDRRVLEDVRLLSENGYGEDSFGNNLPLPDELSYLRK